MIYRNASCALHKPCEDLRRKKARQRRRVSSEKSEFMHRVAKHAQQSHSVTDKILDTQSNQ